MIEVLQIIGFVLLGIVLLIVGLTVAFAVWLGVSAYRPEAPHDEDFW